MLVFGVLVVRQGGAERVVEDRYGFIEGDAMLLEIAGGFGRIKLEVEAGECHTWVVCDILARRERSRRPASQVRTPGISVAPSRDAPISESRVGAVVDF